MMSSSYHRMSETIFITGNEKKKTLPPLLNNSRKACLYLVIYQHTPCHSSSRRFIVVFQTCFVFLHRFLAAHDFNQDQLNFKRGKGRCSYDGFENNSVKLKGKKWYDNRNDQSSFLSFKIAINIKSRLLQGKHQVTLSEKKKKFSSHG